MNGGQVTTIADGSPCVGTFYTAVSGQSVTLTLDWATVASPLVAGILVVNTRGYQIDNMGTHFTVQAYRSDPDEPETLVYRLYPPVPGHAERDEQPKVNRFDLDVWLKRQVATCQRRTTT